MLSWGRAEVVIKLIDKGYGVDDSVEAAHNCGDLQRSLRYLKQECPVCIEERPMSKVCVYLVSYTQLLWHINQSLLTCVVISAEDWIRWPTTVTAKYNSSRQNKICHGKIQFKTTNSNYSRQTISTHGKSKNNYCNSKLITARAKRSLQEQNAHGKSKKTCGKSEMLMAKSN